MIHGEGYKPKPLPSWRKCPLIQASRKTEFRPIPDHMTPVIRHLPEHIRTTLNGCKVSEIVLISRHKLRLAVAHVFTRIFYCTEPKKRENK